MQRLISTPVQSQRQAAHPVLQAAGLRRREEQRTLLQRQVLEQQARTVHLPTDTTRQVLLRQPAPPPPMKAYHQKIARSALAEISAFPARYTTFTTFLASLKVNAQRVAQNYNPYIHLPAKMTVSFQEKLDTPNAIRVHIGPNDTDLYDSKNWREILEARYGKANVSSTTVANKDDRMIHMAGERHPVTQVVYDGRGFPIFDAHSAVDLHIPVAIASQKGKDKQHYEAATRELKAMIHSGKVERSRFTAAQLQDIEKERQKITDYTGHHHQDFARMQLVKTFEPQHLTLCRKWRPERSGA